MGIGLNFSSIISYFLLLLGLYVIGSIILRFFKFPLKLIVNLICNGLIGIGMLLLLNAFLAGFSISVVINPFNVLFVGLLGVPGVICLLILGFIL